MRSRVDGVFPIARNLAPLHSPQVQVEEYGPLVGCCLLTVLTRWGSSANLAIANLFADNPPAYSRDGNPSAV